MNDGPITDVECDLTDVPSRARESELTLIARFIVAKAFDVN
jgi:hypothetical protein